jgi:hypothetical protein
MAYSDALKALLKSQGISDAEIAQMEKDAAASSSKPAKPKKSGIFTSVQTSNNIPADSTLTSYVNDIFQKYYGRDASQTELQDYLPQLKAQYTGPKGKTQTNVEYTYKNGELVSTKYLTKDNADPKVWLEDTLKTKLNAGDTTVNSLNIPEGPAGKYFVAVKNFAAQNGINLSDSAATDYATGIASGSLSEDTVFNTVRESAANAFPSLADKIKSGINLKTLADPYIQSMSNILEIPDTGIDLFDPKIRSAMSYTMPDGKVGTKSIYDFEKELRQDPRWQYTNNAREQASSIATTVLKDFGFMG